MGEKEFELIRTADGSYTFHHPEFNEAYHSVSAGAVEESLKKFFLPSRLQFFAQNQKKISVLEVGFGLGYNCAVTLTELLKVNRDLEIEYFALEYKLAPLEGLSLAGTPYAEIYEVIKREIPRSGFFKWKKIKCGVLFGDARRRIFDLPTGYFDAVFHDAFSPKRNAELWTLEFIDEVLRRLKEGRFWITYSSALAVRRALWEAGADVFNTRAVGRKQPGTAASFGGKPDGEWIYPLSEREVEKILTSPYAVPFRDPTLSAPREVILRRWEREVGERLGRV
jgi:chorismate dehydratase